MNTDENPYWPKWLEAIYGPEPEGPCKRAKALKLDAQRKAEAEARLDALPHAPPAMQPKAPAERTYSAEEMAKARATLVGKGMPPGLDANGKPIGSGEAPLRPEAAA